MAARSRHRQWLNSSLFQMGTLSRRLRLKRLLEIANEIVHVFQTDGQTQQILRRYRMRAFYRSAMFDKALDAAQARGASE